jgi:ketosteroid isomerase-like protein
MDNNNMPLLEKLLQAGAASDWDAVASCVSDDFVIIEPDLLPYGGRHYGAAGFRNMIEIFQRTWADPQFEILLMGQIADVLLMKGILRAHSTATGRYVEAPCAEFFTVRDAELVSSEVFYANEALVVSALTPDQSRAVGE